MHKHIPLDQSDAESTSPETPEPKRIIGTPTCGAPSSSLKTAEKAARSMDPCDKPEQGEHEDRPGISVWPSFWHQDGAMQSDMMDMMDTFWPSSPAPASSQITPTTPAPASSQITDWPNFWQSSWTGDNHSGQMINTHTHAYIHTQTMFES
eukprot:1567306-Pyramimonas_sp.AAC.1